ncbi:MAG: hypothetical protein LBD55_07595 [Treponema sp.]|nr:hypothetical protein [Treponema sp.]
MVQAPLTGGMKSPVRLSEGGIVEEIRSAAERGTPSSLQNGLDLIRSRELGGSEFGRVMNTVIVTLIQKVYPNPMVRSQFPVLDPSQSRSYTKILQDAEQGIYAPPQPNSQDYLEYMLPFLAFLEETNRERLLSALPNLKRAEELNPHGVLAPYFTGLVYERANQINPASLAYERAYTLSSECYPAALGLVRIMEAQGRAKEAIRLLEDLVFQFPDNIIIKRQLALAYYRNRDWSQAEPAIREVLQRNNREAEFLLMQAHALVEQGQLLKAAAPLDLYAAVNPANRLYLFLRARVQAEGYRNQEAALTYLRSILRLSMINDEVSVYAAGLLLESNREEDQTEGQALLRHLLEAGTPSLAVMDLAFKDAIRREAWQEAKSYLTRLLNERFSSQYLASAYMVERGLGNHGAALSYAKRVYEQDPSNEEGSIAYISALIDSGRREEAGNLIETRLASLGGGTVKARYYYLRSRIGGDEEAALDDLRSSLFEDPRNLNALIALFDIYRKRGDERRAVYYYKQALSFAPNNPYLRKYEKEYGEQR